MALSKVTSAVVALVNETQTNSVNGLGDYIITKLGSEYDDEFVEAVKSLIQEYKENEMKKIDIPKGKKTKDPNAPKRAPTEYNLFIKEKMAEIKAQNPDLKGQSLMGAATKLWNERKGTESSDDAEPKAAKGKAAKGKGNGKDKA